MSIFSRLPLDIVEIIIVYTPSILEFYNEDAKKFTCLNGCISKDLDTTRITRIFDKWTIRVSHIKYTYYELLHDSYVQFYSREYNKPAYISTNKGFTCILWFKNYIEYRGNDLPLHITNETTRQWYYNKRDKTLPFTINDYVMRFNIKGSFLSIFMNGIRLFNGKIINVLNM